MSWNHLRRILFATDFSENSRSALECAAIFAERFRAPVHMLHVLALEGDQATPGIHHGTEIRTSLAVRRLETLATGLRRIGLRVETQVAVGNPSDLILDIARQSGADLLAIGLQVLHRGSSNTPRGAVAEKLLRCAVCPVLSAGADVLAGFDLGRNLDHLLLISDLSGEAACAASYASFLASELKVQAEACIWGRLGLEDQEERLLYSSASLGTSTPEANKHSFLQQAVDAAGRSMTSDQVIQTAMHQSAGLIVLGMQSLDTSVVRQVLFRSACPVITVRNAASSREAA